jgi:hypothetical protein
MGCCVPKPKKEEIFNHFHHLPLYDTDKVVNKMTITCYFCKDLILHEYERVTVCNTTKKVIGHCFCVSMYCDSDCPVCNTSHKSTIFNVLKRW